MSRRFGGGFVLLNMKMRIMKLQIPQSLRGSIARYMLLRILVIALGIPIFTLYVIEPPKLFSGDSYGCALDVAYDRFSFPGRFLKPMSTYTFPPVPSYLSVPCKERTNLTIDLFRELMNENLLNSDAKALCFGKGSASAVSALRRLGFSDAIGVHCHSFFSLKRKNFVHELEFVDNSFDFVFSSEINRVSVPALLVLEIERVLKPGGVGAMLVNAPHSNPSSLIKSATPISSFLKNSDVVNVRRIRSFSLVIFKKKLNGVNPFEHYKLPDECPSIKNNKPFMHHLEPLIEKKSMRMEGSFSYLPKFVNMTSRKRFIYVDIGAGELMNSNTKNWFFNSYPLRSQMFDVYVVDHDTSVLSSYVKRPGITFVYHPGLAESQVSDLSDPSEYDEGFDFLVWFRETVAAGDFIVLKMNAMGVELKLLHELFESGAICFIDELFLRCPNSLDGPGNKRADCMDLFNGLRSSGVFVHQWLED